MIRAALALWLLVALAAGLTQPRIDRNGGRGWDGASYARVAEQLAAGQRPAAPAPFVARVGVPALAALVSPDDVLRGFLLVNLAASALATALLAVWLERHIAGGRLRLALLAGSLASWLGPLRFSWFYPAYVDPWLMLALLGGLLLLDEPPTWRRVAALAALSAAGACVREVALLPALVGLVAWRWRALPALAAGVAALLAVRAWVVVEPSEYSTLWIIVEQLVFKRPWEWLLGWLLAYGPALALARWRRLPPHLVLYLAAVVLLSYVGGSDTERLALWAAPVVLILVAPAGRLAAAVCLLAVALPWPIPAEPAAYLNWTASHGEAWATATLLAAHGLGLAWALGQRRRLARGR